jgi:predicted HTH transcriptional regulator
MKSNIKNTLDDIPAPDENAQSITGLIKENGEITGYQLSNNKKISRQDAVNLARRGKIKGVGIAHNGNTEYLKSIPNSNESDNLGNLPTVE